LDVMDEELMADGRWNLTASGALAGILLMPIVMTTLLRLLPAAVPLSVVFIGLVAVGMVLARTRLRAVAAGVLAGTVVWTAFLVALFFALSDHAH
jgi:hypothetical protein